MSPLAYFLHNKNNKSFVFFLHWILMRCICFANRSKILERAMVYCIINVMVVCLQSGGEIMEEVEIYSVR